MSLKTISKNGPSKIEIDLADDCLEVRGYGKPILEEVAQEMTDQFYRDCEAAYKIVEALQSDRTYTRKENDPQFEALKKLLDPDKQVVSGVFGKEIILQLLAQRNCDGLRYALGTDEYGSNTVILYGVKQALKEDGSDVIVSTNRPNGTPYHVAQSEPLSHKIAGLQMTVAEKPINGEVHENSITRGEAARRSEGLIDSINDVLFGRY